MPPHVHQHPRLTASSQSERAAAIESLRPLRPTAEPVHLLPADAPERLRAPLLGLLLTNSRAKAAELSAWLSPQHTEGEHFLNNVSAAEMWSMFTPTFPCLFTLEKHPTSAAEHDGGKWICGLQEMGRAARRQHKGSCTVYSVGSAMKFDFEARVHRVAPQCDIHTFDPTVAAHMVKRFVPSYIDAFHRVGLGRQAGALGFGRCPSCPIMPLTRLMSSLNHSSIDILKVDVEGFEFRGVLTAISRGMRIGQLLVELHPSAFGLRASGRAVDTVHRTLISLREAGLHLFSIEPVTMRDHSQVEAAFVNEDWTPAGWLR